MNAPAAAALLESRDVTSMIDAAAHRVGIFGGVGYLDHDDVIAELVAVAVECAARFDPRRHSKFTTLLWPRLYGCAVDLRRRHGRKSRRGKARPVEVSLDAATLKTVAVDGPEARLDLETALAALPASERAVVLMRDYGGLEAETIAGMMGCEPGDCRLERRLGLRRLRVGLPVR